jgi:murein L,D-transpeptidase YcbB/YkuD
LGAGPLRFFPWLLAIPATFGPLTVAWFFLLRGPADEPAAHVAELTTGALSSIKQPESSIEQPEPPNAAMLIVRKMLSSVPRGANRKDLAAAVAFYKTRTGPLIWLTKSGLSDKGRAVIAEIRKADDWGLRAQDFTLPTLPPGEPSPEAAAAAEVTVTLAVLKYARYARGGRIGNPSLISKLLNRRPPLRAPSRVLADIAATDAADAYLRDLHPKHEQFVRLRKLLLKLRRGDAAKTEIAYGENLQERVPHLQPSSADVSPPPPLRAETAAEIDRILVNMERWRWMQVDLGTLYIWNNVPEFVTRVIKNGKIINSDRIIVGQPDWPTPSFSANMRTIVFHPSWGVPDGIKRKELGPLLRNSSSGGLVGLFTGAQSSRAVLEAHNLQVYYNGGLIDPNQVDWASANISTYEFRQPPGPTNVLGEVKFLFPNKFDVYMHDTPNHSGFSRDFRGLSHGCMRVDDPRRLAAVLLAEDKGWSEEKVQSLFQGGTTQVALKEHIPVHITYFTAMVDDSGKLRVFSDLYDLDARVGRALLGRNVRFETRSYADEVPTTQRAEPARPSRQPRLPGARAPTLADAIADIFSP